MPKASKPMKATQKACSSISRRRNGDSLQDRLQFYVATMHHCSQQLSELSSLAAAAQSSGVKSARDLSTSVKRLSHKTRQVLQMLEFLYSNILNERFRRPSLIKRTRKPRSSKIEKTAYSQSLTTSRDLQWAMPEEPSSPCLARIIS